MAILGLVELLAEVAEETHKSKLPRGITSYNTSAVKGRRDFLEEAKIRMSNTATMLQFEILLFNHTFNEDDGKVSFSEKRALKKHFTRYRNRITPKDMEDIKKLSRIESSISEIKSYVYKAQLNNDMVRKGLNSLKKVCGKKERYSQIISYIEKSLILPMEY